MSNPKTGATRINIMDGYPKTGATEASPGKIYRPFSEEEDESCIQACLNQLQLLVPTISSETQLHPVQLLQHVIDYILDLELTLDATAPDRQQGSESLTGGSLSKDALNKTDLLNSTSEPSRTDSTVLQDIYKKLQLSSPLVN